MISQRMHPQTIISGYRKALKVAQDALSKAAVNSGYAYKQNK